MSPCAGMLLTGGTSRRMGRDKAAIPIDTPIGPVTLAQHTWGLLGQVCARAVEVGPGRAGAWSVREDPPGGGPLAAVAAGWEALAGSGWTGAVLVVATDLPRLTGGLLRWLGTHPAEGAVVPLAGGRVQPLCARYRPADLELATRLVAQGRRAMTDLLEAVHPVLIAESEWSVPAGGAGALDDVDTPADLARVDRS